MLPFARFSLHFPILPPFARYSIAHLPDAHLQGRLVYYTRASFSRFSLHWPYAPSGLLPTGVISFPRFSLWSITNGHRHLQGGVAQMQGRQMQGGFIIILIQIRTQVDLWEFCILCRTLITQVAVRAIKAQQGAKASKCS